VSEENHVRKTVIATTALLCLVSAAQAAPSATPSSYDVEILVFENKRPDLDGGEVWRHPNTQLLVSEVTSAGVAEIPATGDTGLSSASALLAQDGNYRVLAHYRWSQVPEARSATPPMRIRSADQSLDGVVRFYLSRFLHVDVNLAFADGKLNLAANDIPEPATIYRLTEHRRVKTQEYQYFDHPKFGALVRVTQAGKP
jgi:hypothetical protein